MMSLMMQCIGEKLHEGRMMVVLLLCSTFDDKQAVLRLLYALNASAQENWDN